ARLPPARCRHRRAWRNGDVRKRRRGPGPSVNGLAAAIQFLTVLPAGRPATRESSGAWYALVGLLIGGLVAIVFAGAERVAGPTVGAAAAVVAGAVLTGALHLDGLADVADAAFAPVSKARRLEILRDVHHGTFGVVAIAAV